MARSTSDSAIRAWTRCKEIEKQDVYFSVHPARQLIGFSVKRGPDVIDFLGMTYNSAEMTCTGPFGQGAAEVVIDKDTRFTLQSAREQPIVCTRNLEESEDGTQHFAASEVAIRAEGQPPLIVSLPREELYEPSYSSQIRESLGNLQNALDETKRRISEIDRSFQESLASVTERFDEYSRGLSIMSVLIMRGEHQRMGEPYFRPIWCGSESEFARGYCGDSPAHIEKVYQRSGDKCGYTYFVVSCVK
ncbi:MAG: hypothetical protein OXH79_20750 [Boseongicola sp.]|nr:hypothetical protein [Boseongicola sp.]